MLSHSNCGCLFLRKLYFIEIKQTFRRFSRIMPYWQKSLCEANIYFLTKFNPHQWLVCKTLDSGNGLQIFDEHSLTNTFYFSANYLFQWIRSSSFSLLFASAKTPIPDEAKTINWNFYFHFVVLPKVLWSP